MGIKDTDDRLKLSVNDRVKFEVDLHGVCTQGVLLRHSGEVEDIVTGGPVVSFTGRIDYYTRNLEEVDTLDEMIVWVDVVVADDQPKTSLGSGIFNSTTRPKELRVTLELELEQTLVRDIKDQVLRTPEAKCVFEGEVVRAATPFLGCYFKVTQFWIGVE